MTTPSGILKELRSVLGPIIVNIIDKLPFKVEKVKIIFFV